MGHMTFCFGMDLSFFTVDSMAIFNHYNGICDESTYESNFKIGNEKCKNKLDFIQ